LREDRQCPHCLFFLEQASHSVQAHPLIAALHSRHAFSSAVWGLFSQQSGFLQGFIRILSPHEEHSGQLSEYLSGSFQCVACCCIRSCRNVGCLFSHHNTDRREILVGIFLLGAYFRC
jgi:hypothetical protein